jgi:hypothetical protein
MPRTGNKTSREIFMSNLNREQLLLRTFVL